MPTDTKLKQFVINELTKSQFEAIDNPSEDELFAVTDDDTYATTEALATKANQGLDNLSANGLEKLGYKTAVVTGLIVNTEGGVTNGRGRAIVTWWPNGFVQVRFQVKIDQVDASTGNYKWGLNRDLLCALNSEVPKITPTGGIYSAYTEGGTRRNADYASTFTISGGSQQFWLPGRIYTIDGQFGGWPSSQYPVGTIIDGIAYGTYTV